MNYLFRLLAWRYLGGTRYDKNISTMAHIAFWGIVIGTFSLALVVAIMNGFEKETHAKLQSINPQISIRAFGNELDVKSLTDVLNREYPEVIAIAPHDTEHVMIQDPHSDSIQTIIGLQGIIPEQERLVTSLEASLQHSKSLEDIIHDNGVVIGTKLAQGLGVRNGDTVTLLYAPSRSQGSTIKLKQREAVITGMFSTGIDDLDTSIAFCHLDFLMNVFPDAGPTQLDLKLRQGITEEPIIKSLQHRLGIDVYSWKDLYPALVAALKLEKYAMFFILALITLVASMNIISLLFMQITQKRGDIAILQSMGATAYDIRMIFIMMGMLLSLMATIIGLIFACGASWILNHYPFIALPDVYYVTHLPSHMEWPIIVAVFIAVALLSLISIVLPTRRIASISVSNVLRFEA
ncbi:ABC transporter permease [Candidatus Babeliales bacterium]|nr:ABC transporter permease [Candidatus Babeliales bacterium]